ncbi:MAG: arginine deiminase family protein [Patescibacteria group bacterium]
MQKHILMCKPTYFDVRYKLSTNSWMNPDNKPDIQLAQWQWNELYRACLEEVVLVDVVPPQPNLLDMTFVANAGLPHKDTFILSNYFHPERRQESQHNAEFLRKMYGNRHLWFLAENALFEGEGDAVWLNEHQLIIAYGVRTNLEGVKAIARILETYDPKIEVVPLPMRPNDKFYHLDTCLVYLSHAKTFLIYDYPFFPEAIEKLKHLGRVVTVDKEAAEKFICNSVVMNEKTIFMPWANERTKDLLNSFGYTKIRTFDMSEFMKSGGAVKCLILEMQPPI